MEAGVVAKEQIRCYPELTKRIRTTIFAYNSEFTAPLTSQLHLNA